MEEVIVWLDVVPCAPSHPKHVETVFYGIASSDSFLLRLFSAKSLLSDFQRKH